MHRIRLKRVPFSEAADRKLRTMKARIGVSPNLVCRLGFCLSLDEPGVPSRFAVQERPGREINRHTLLGEYDVVFESLLKAWVAARANDGNDIPDLDLLLVMHMNRGVELVTARIKTLEDLGSVVRN